MAGFERRNTLANHHIAFGEAQNNSSQPEGKHTRKQKPKRNVSQAIAVHWAAQNARQEVIDKAHKGKNHPAD